MEILICNFRKRVPKKKVKRNQGMKMIHVAMEKLKIRFMKNGSIKNEHDLLFFIVAEGFP